MLGHESQSTTKQNKTASASQGTDEVSMSAKEDIFFAVQQQHGNTLQAINFESLTFDNE